MTTEVHPDDQDKLEARATALRNATETANVTAIIDSYVDGRLRSIVEDKALLDDLRAQLVADEQRITELAANLIAAGIENEGLKQQVREGEQRIAALRLQITALEKQIADLKNPPTDEPPPPLGRVVTTFKLTSKVGGVGLPHTFGQSFRKGDLPAGQSVSIEGVKSNARILNRWEDGSAKFAEISGLFALIAGQPTQFNLREAAPPAITRVQPLLIPPSLEIDGIGKFHFLESDVAILSVSDVLNESFVWKQLNPDVFACLTVRHYGNGLARIRTKIHVARGKNYPIKGRLFRGIEVLSEFDFDAKVLSRPGFITWLGADPQITMEHDRAYLKSTNKVPNYMDGTPTEAAYTGLVQNAVPMGRANLRANFGETGYHGQIGIIPLWDALYVTSGDPRAYNAVLANAEVGASYSIHVLDPVTMGPLKLSASKARKYGDVPLTGGTAYSHDVSHQPSIGYLAYLLTADRHYLEEVQYWAVYNALAMAPPTRSLSIFHGTARGVAWGLRTLATAAVITPDDDPLQAEFSAAWAEVINHYYEKYITGTKANNRNGPNNLGAMELYSGGSSGDPYYANDGIWSDAPWMQHFLQQSIAFTAELEIPGQSIDDFLKHLALVEFAMQHVVGILGDPKTGRPAQHAGEYVASYGTTVTVDELKSKTVHYGSWKEEWEAWKPYAATKGKIFTDPVGPELLGESGGSPDSMATGYWGNLHPAIALAVDAGVPGAVESWFRLTDAPNYAKGAKTFSNAPQFGIVPRGRVIRPPIDEPDEPPVDVPPIDPPVEDPKPPADHWSKVIEPSEAMITNHNDMPNPYPRGGLVGTHATPYQNWGGLVWVGPVLRSSAAGHYGSPGGGSAPTGNIYDADTGLHGLGGVPWPADYATVAGKIDPVWLDVETDQGFEPMGDHGYYSRVALTPEEMRATGLFPDNKKGGVLWTQIIWDRAPHRSAFAPHIQNLDDLRYHRFGDRPIPFINPEHRVDKTDDWYMYPAGGPYCGAWKDTRRGIVYFALVHANRGASIDLKTGKISIVLGIDAPSNYYKPIYDHDEDVGLFIGNKNIVGRTDADQLDMFAFDHSSGALVRKKIILEGVTLVVNGGGIGVDRCPDDGDFYIWEGNGTKRVIGLHPPGPGKWFTHPWTTREEQMLCDFPIPCHPNPGSGTRPYGGWGWVARHKCFEVALGPLKAKCYDDVERIGPVLAYRPPGVTL